MNLIKLQNVSKIYQHGKLEMVALKDITITVQKGQFLAIMGPSGSGKSTLMHIIGLLDRPTSGSYFLEGKEISLRTSDKVLPRLRQEKFGFVFQTFNLLPRLRALDQVILPTIYARAKNRWQKAEKVLEKVGLKERINHCPSELSGGEQQRVAIARALVNSPEIILADEPTGNLDSKSGEEILKILIELNKEGKTVILVTHDPNLANQAERIIKLKDGRIV